MSAHTRLCSHAMCQFFSSLLCWTNAVVFFEGEQVPAAWGYGAGGPAHRDDADGRSIDVFVTVNVTISVSERDTQLYGNRVS